MTLCSAFELPRAAKANFIRRQTGSLDFDVKWFKTELKNIESRLTKKCLASNQ